MNSSAIDWTDRLQAFGLTLSALGLACLGLSGLALTGAVAVVLGLALWAWSWRSLPRLKWLPVVLAFFAVAFLSFAWPQPGSGRWLRQLRQPYTAEWERLAMAAEEAAVELVSLSPPPVIEEDDPAHLRLLFEMLESTIHGSLTGLLVDSEGEVVAWSGPSLPIDSGQHGPFTAGLPARGGARAFVRPDSITFTASHAIAGTEWTGWLVTAAHSFSSSALPWKVQGESVHWSVDEGGSAAIGALVVDGGGWPDLWVSGADLPTYVPPPRRLRGLPLMAVLLALILVLRAETSSVDGRWLCGMLAVSSLLAWSAIPWWVSAEWSVLGLVAYLISRQSAVTGRRNHWGLPAAAIVAALIGAFWSVAQGIEPGSRESLQVSGLRPIAPATLILLSLVASAAWVVYRNRSAEAEQSGLTGVHFLGLGLLLLVGALAVDRPLVAFGTALLSILLVRRRWQCLSDFAALLLLTMLLSLIWTASERLAIAWSSYQSRHDLGLMTANEVTSLRRQVELSLEDVDIVSLTLGQTSIDSFEALGFGLWQGSALNRGDLESVLAVINEGEVSSSYERGLALSDLFPDDAIDVGEQELLLRPLPSSPEAVGRSESRLFFDSRYFADIAFAWRPVAGYRWLRHQRPEAPDVSSQAPDSPPGRIRPDLLGNDFWLRSADGAYFLTLPALRPLQGLERFAGRLALGVCLTLVLAVIARTGLLGSRWAQRSRALWHSYPRRLALALGGLILVPLLLVNLAILTLHQRGLATERERLEQTALDSARQAVYSHLDALPANFIVTDMDNDFFADIASIVGRDVDLYNESSLYATSRPSQFAAGAIGARLPASVYRDLILEHRSHSRLAATEARQAAVYAPLDRVGGSTGPDLILAVPVTGRADELGGEARVVRSRILLLGFGILLVGLWATSRAAKWFSRPIMEMIAGTERIAAGARSLDIELPEEQDLSRLAAAIDEMAANVNELQERERIERELVELILSNVTTGVVLVTSDGTVSRANPIAEEILGVSSGSQFPADLRSPLDRAAAFSVPFGDTSPQRSTITVETDGKARLWHLARLAVESHSGPAALWVVEDVTDVVRGERLAAWGEMARIIAHEVKNPLTPIRLSAEHLREVFRKGPSEQGPATVERCTNNILQQVEDLRQIADEFSDYSRIPDVRPELFPLVAWVREVADGYQPDAADSRIRLTVGENTPETIFADRRLLTRVLRNLIENALRAGGDSVVEVQVAEGGDDTIEVSVLDRGPGVSESDLDRIFEPYFSTHETGTGLGLPISRRIVEAHGGTIEASLRNGPGLRVRAVLPQKGELSSEGHLPEADIDTRQGVQ